MERVYKNPHTGEISAVYHYSDRKVLAIYYPERENRYVVNQHGNTIRVQRARKEELAFNARYLRYGQKWIDKPVQERALPEYQSLVKKLVDKYPTAKIGEYLDI